MAVVTTKSAQITNRDATPSVISNARVTGAPVMHAHGLVAVANGDSVGSKLIACSVPSNAIIQGVYVTSADIGTTTTADVGVYQTTLNGAAVVDADFFASALSLSGGAISRSDATHEAAAAYLYTDREEPLWQALGLTADSNRMYDIVATLTGAADAAGTVLIEVEYTI